MNNYLIQIKEKGFEAFFVGGYVRDKLLQKQTFDIDVATNASLEDLKVIFKEKKYSINDWCLTMTEGSYSIQITPYRMEEDYLDYRHPKVIKKVDTILEDSKRRDFTINALYQDENGKIYDFYHGIDHIKNKKLVMIGDPFKRIEEDPLRILRALRFSSIDNLSIDSDLENAILTHKDKLWKVSYFRKKQELEKIYLYGDIDIIRKYHLQEYFHLNQNYQKKNNIYEFWKQVDIKYYPFTKEEIKKIEET